MDILENYQQYLEVAKEIELAEEDTLSEEEFNALGEEELQEISKETVKSYALKSLASKSKASDAAKEAGDKASKASKAYRRVKAAGPDKDYGETDDQHGERVDRLYRRNIGALKDVASNIRTAEKRRKGLDMAGKRLAKEEVEMDENAEVVKTEEQIDETAALDTLKPNSRPAPDAKSKVGMMQNVLGAMSVANKGDLTHWFHQAMALWGPNKDWGVPDGASEKNKKSTDMAAGAGPKTKDPMPKLNVKEDVEAMFEGQDLSEEFKENASTLFEAAISARMIAETARLEEEYETKFAEEVDSLAEELSAKLDSYLDYVVEQWMEENEVAIESTLRNELMEEFIDGLKGLFAEHYINVPEEKVDVLESLADKVSDLETKLDAAITENAELKGALVEESAKNIFEEVASTLALTQREKFAALAEGVDFDGDLETYEKKLKIVKENYFKTEKTASTNINEETFIAEETEEKPASNPLVERYVQHLSRSTQK
jgi:hypothetical protein